jgi:hypothetical protein
LRAQMIAEAACVWTRWAGRISMPIEAGAD